MDTNYTEQNVQQIKNQLNSAVISTQFRSQSAQRNLEQAIAQQKNNFANQRNLSKDSQKSNTSGTLINNSIFHICYNGEVRQFALYGQILTKGEEFNPIPPLELSGVTK